MSSITITKRTHQKPWVAVVKTADGRVGKYQDFDERADAEAHVAKYGGFVAEPPNGNAPDWAVVDGALTLDPLPVSAAEPSLMERIASLEEEIASMKAMP